MSLYNWVKTGLYPLKIKDMYYNYDDIKDEIEDFHKVNKSDKIWWTSKIDCIGCHLFTFDKKKIYSVFPACANDLSEEEADILRKENPIMARLAGY